MKPDSGQIVFHDRGRANRRAAGSAMRSLMQFRRKMQYIFQDPFGSLYPRMTVFDIVRGAARHPWHRRRRLSCRTAKDADACRSAWTRAT